MLPVYGIYESIAAQRQMLGRALARPEIQPHSLKRGALGYEMHGRGVCVQAPPT